ncbi:TatD family hydrolase [Arthrobacter rhombi]|uniref:TatD family hydrolase n=1 Tax=Arthrobacter rhombi TaxID=71253 RepID=UPI0031DF5F14
MCSSPDANTPEAVTAGATPPAYRAEEAPLDAAATADGAPRRAATAAHGGKRDTSYPPAPEPLAVPVVDNHTHLDFRDGEVNVSVARALDTANAVGVGGIIQVGCDVESSRFAVATAEADERVLAAVAIHPNDAAVLAARGELDAALADLAELAPHPRVRAVGETGLDYFRTGEEGRPAQQDSFRAHLELAVAHGKAVQIHDRDAHDDIVRILGQAPVPDVVVFHCFSGDAELARICNANGWYMSFSGTVTFKNSDGLREALAVADPSLVLVETDAPFLTPHPYRGRPNASYLIPYTVRSMAGTLEAEVDVLCSRIAENTTAAYGSFRA